ncbi:MAG: Asp-tRNA(Asn)/Glu-tRNA(Gln) amidotransferase subunit GatA [Firmicutes bacterium]|nr:Asp-tRNA(Asn)/Glu-tRNA(Gln) amidotransferase subunit GatA [Bacillota bacterium]MBQ6606602.1 Asp-tRNA(Asn)/Glu-tRNA(Gln) amidotransferase subunit GatA [Bacillota bacterium]
MPITDMTACELAAALTEKRLSSREATAAYLDRIAALDKEINSYITVTPEQAMKDAEASDKRRAEGRALSPLDGVPMALKDVICSKGVRTTAASKILYNFVPPYDATCWSRLKAGGAVLLGKVNMDEFAMGSSTETSAFGPTRNPWDEERVPGGSSGGSAAAVAAGLAAYSLGTDTGGSVRQPAHFCGVVGLKPTYGRVSRYGVIPYASSLDQVGVLARDCRDAASVLQLIAGQDRMDSTSAPAPVEDYASACGEDITGLKIGLPKEFMSDAIAPDIAFAMRQGAERLAAEGAVVEEVSLPHSAYALPTYYILASAEASSNLARYDGVRYGARTENAENVYDMFTATRSANFGAEVKRRIMLGTFALSSGYYDAYYNKTMQVRTLIKQDYDQAFAAGFDCLMTPAAPTTAFKLGEMTDDPLTMYMQDICTVPVNLAGLPGLVVPVGLDNGNLPIGAQLIGRSFGERTLFSVGSRLESPLRLQPGLEM